MVIQPRRTTEKHLCNTQNDLCDLCDLYDLYDLMPDTTVREQCKTIEQQMRQAGALNAGATGATGACEAVLGSCGWQPGMAAAPIA